MKQRWTPFVEMQRPAEAKERFLMSGDPDFHIWRNSLYQVLTSKIYPHNSETGERITTGNYILQLSIKRIDRMAIHDWRDLQRIKNELAGEEMLAVEIYPPESKLLDTANQYFLWVVPPTWVDSVFAFIFQNRMVSETNWRDSRQRPWPNDSKPKDLVGNEGLDAYYREHFGVDDNKEGGK